MDCYYGTYYGDTVGGYANGFGCILYNYIIEHSDDTCKYVLCTNDEKAFFIGEFANGMPVSDRKCICSTTGYGKKEDFEVIRSLKEKHKKKYGRKQRSDAHAAVFQTQRDMKKPEKKITSAAATFGFDIDSGLMYVDGIWDGHNFRGAAVAVTGAGNFEGIIGEACDIGKLDSDESKFEGKIYKKSKSRQFQGMVTYPNGDVFIGVQSNDSADDDDASYMEGTYSYANGDVYIGRMNIDEARHGFGVLFRGGEEISGVWERDELID